MLSAVPASTDALTVLSQWRIEPFTTALLLAAGSLYARGRRARAARLRRVAGGRTAAFAAGLATLVAALCSPVDAYADVSFTVHMAQHLLLTLLAPPLLALGAPITLALRAGSPAVRRWVDGVPALAGRGLLREPDRRLDVVRRRPGVRACLAAVR